MDERLRVVREYLALLGRFEQDEAAYRELLHEDAVFTIFPSLLNGEIAVFEMEEALAGMARGSELMNHQRYEIVSSFGDAEGARFCVEAVWTAEIAVERPPLTAGQEITAHVCMLFEFRDGRIVSQHNYDCYVPFA